jgi:hypothetical protein
MNVAAARPNPVVLAWRWRYGLVLGAGLAAAGAETVHLAGAAGLAWGALSLLGLAALIASWPGARKLAVARAWCVITPQRFRVGCAQAWVHSRDGKIPVIVWTRARPFGERMLLWCRAGTSLDDLEATRAQLAAACWARDLRVTPSGRFSHLVSVDVVREKPSEPRRPPEHAEPPRLHREPPPSTRDGPTVPLWLGTVPDQRRAPPGTAPDPRRASPAAAELARLPPSPSQAPRARMWPWTAPIWQTERPPATRRRDDGE